MHRIIMSKQNNPWVPVNMVNGLPDGDAQPASLISPITMQLPDPRTVMASSEDYIAGLEAKLSRLKGRQRKEPSSRDMVDSLCRVREDHMRIFVESSSDPFSSNFSEGGDTDTIDTSAIQRRLHPERQAVNAEELQVLVDTDELQRLKDTQEESGNITNSHTDSDNQTQKVVQPCGDTTDPSARDSSNSQDTQDDKTLQAPHR